MWKCVGGWVRQNRIYALRSVRNVILFLRENRNLWTLLVELSVSARNMKNFRKNKQPIHVFC